MPRQPGKSAADGPRQVPGDAPGDTGRGGDLPADRSEDPPPEPPHRGDEHRHDQPGDGCAQSSGRRDDAARHHTGQPHDAVAERGEQCPVRPGQRRDDQVLHEPVQGERERHQEVPPHAGHRPYEESGEYPHRHGGDAPSDGGQQGAVHPAQPVPERGEDRRVEPDGRRDDAVPDHGHDHVTPQRHPRPHEDRRAQPPHAPADHGGQPSQSVPQRGQDRLVQPDQRDHHEDPAQPGQRPPHGAQQHPVGGAGGGDERVPDHPYGQDDHQHHDAYRNPDERGQTALARLVVRGRLMGAVRAGLLLLVHAGQDARTRPRVSRAGSSSSSCHPNRDVRCHRDVGVHRGRPLADVPATARPFRPRRSRNGRCDPIRCSAVAARRAPGMSTRPMWSERSEQ